MHRVHPTLPSLWQHATLLPCATAGRNPRTHVNASQATKQHDELQCVVGIDLGTTNSAVAVIEGNEPVTISNQEGFLTTPSVVSFKHDGGVLVGTAAKRAAAANPEETFYSVKRFIGRHYDECLEDAGLVAFSVAEDAAGSGSVVLRSAQADAGALYPEEVSAYVVAKLIAAAEEYTGRQVGKAVISVPAYFNDEQREATATAGRLAGLEAVRIIREPVAAALAYGLSAESDQTVLVFDLGGGTFDVSMLEVGGGVIEVLSTGGDAHLGGDDWDAAIVDWLIRTELRPRGVDVNDPRIITNLKAVAEAAKIKLSSEERVVIRMPVGGGIEAVLTRQMLDGMTVELFRRARLPLDQAAWQAGVDLGTAVKERDDAVRAAKRKGNKNSNRQAGDDADAEVSTSGNKEMSNSSNKSSKRRKGAEISVEIRPKRRMPVSEVLLVGGATRMPAVRRFVENMTGIKPRESLVDPDLAVALGAAVQAGIYEGQLSDLMVMDVWQASLMRAYARQLELEQQREEEDAEDRDRGNEDAWNDDDLGEEEHDGISEC